MWGYNSIIVWVVTETSKMILIKTNAIHMKNVLGRVKLFCHYDKVFIVQIDFCYSYIIHSIYIELWEELMLIQAQYKWGRSWWQNKYSELEKYDEN